MAKVSLKNVTKIFPPDVVAVKDINIDVADKEFLVLVGPSGCGKSTTLRLIAGLEELTEGEISIDDRVVNHVPPKDRDIAMVFQNYALYPHMTAYKNMAFGLKLRKYRKVEINKRVEEAAEILGISNLLSRKPKALSGGERQRVAVGRAIVRKPKVFLFDEPLSNLDAKLRVQMRTEISKLHNRLQATIVYVTHDQLEAMTMGSRIAVMKDGMIYQTDTPLNLYERPVNKFVAGFIGSPPMNFMEGVLIESDGDFYFDEGRSKIKLQPGRPQKISEHINKKIVFGIRPENISIKSSPTDFDQKTTVPSTVEVVEPMGAEIYLYLTTGIHTYIARVKSHEKVGINQKIDMIFDMSKAHFFDPHTEMAIL